MNMFGGLCAEIAPTDLPEGASPLNYDVDFDIGAVYTRAGLNPVYSFQDLAAGPKFAGSGGQIPVNNVQWTTTPAGVDTVTWLNGQSPILWWNDFGFDLPQTGVTGIEVQISGHYTGPVSPECVLELTLTTDGRGLGIAKTFFFQTNDTTLTLGGPSDTWSAIAAVNEINTPGFGVQFYAISPGQTTSLFINAIAIRAFIAEGLNNVNWIKTFIENDDSTHTFVLDSQGVVWEEDVTHNPGVLVPEITTIYPEQFAHSASNLNEEWIMFSDLKKGTNIPRHGTNWDRVSQVGPGAPPSCVGNATGTNVWGIISITQEPRRSDPEHPGTFQDALWSASPTTDDPGNVLTVFYASARIENGHFVSLPDAHLVVGQAVNIEFGAGTQFASLNGTYIITNQGFARPPGASEDQNGERWMFTVQTVQTSSQNAQAHAQIAGTYQLTLATITLDKLATWQAGDQITIQGPAVGGWAGTYSILKAINGGQYQITGTSLTNGIATYDFTLVSGVLPTAGSIVTITGCVNGPFFNGSSIFNVTNATVNSVTGSSFTIRMAGQPNVAAAVENGNAVELGTVFQFDPGLSHLGLASDLGARPGVFPALSGTAQNPAGTVSLTGGLGAGVRQAVTIFETRNGYLTAPSPPVTFGTTTEDNSIVVSNICIGPPNVIARIVAFTPANGGFFFYIPQDITIPNAGQPLTYTSTRVANNSDTQATFTFTDGLLMASVSIDSPGNDLFNQIEIGASCWVVPYAARNFYGLMNNKVANFVNTTFDGGFLTPGQFNYPAGWTPEPNINSNNGRLVTSPVFGFSYYIFNPGPGTVEVLGGMHQSAFQDAYQVPIIRPNTDYSIRVDVRTPAGITNLGGQLLFDLVSYGPNPPVTGKLFASLGFPLSAMSTQFQTLTGQFLLKGNMPLTVPSDTILRLYASNLPAGADIEIDRFEIYPTREPTLTVDVMASYVDNLEAVDGVSGDLGISVTNNQPVIGAFTQFDLLYFLKTASMFSTQDSPTEEPALWKIREISNKIGTIGIHSYDYGEEWMITACRQGVYIFSGREPIKISQEIQPVWDAINWAAGYTIVVRNDVASRRLFIHVPLPTPNPWLPEALLNPNPTTPNVILMMSYKELQTAAALEDRGPVKVSFSGKLISWDMSRKWSLWQIPSPYSAFVRRPDGTEQLFIGNGRRNSRVYQLDQNALSDDGLAIPGLYTTYGFIQGEEARQYGPVVSMYRKLYKYSSYNISGAGMLKLRALVNDWMPTYPYEAPGGIELTCPGDSNREIPFNLEGQRLFLEFSTNHPEANFRLSEIILSIAKSPWAQVRGIN